MALSQAHTNINVQARMGMHTHALKVGHRPVFCLFALITVSGSRRVVYEEANVVKQITVKRTQSCRSCIVKMFKTKLCQRIGLTTDRKLFEHVCFTLKPPIIFHVM